MSEIKTVKSGKEYRARIDGTSYSFALNSDSGHVMIYSPTRCLGGFLLARFEGALSPASIRRFVEKECAS